MWATVIDPRTNTPWFTTRYGSAGTAIGFLNAVVLDLGASYRTRIDRNKVGVSVQLNVRNAFERSSGECWGRGTLAASFCPPNGPRVFFP